MSEPLVTKVDYLALDDDTTEFLPRLKRIHADINLRIAAIEDIGRKLDGVEKRYGEAALQRIDAAIAPVLVEMRQGLESVKSDLEIIDEAYRANSQSHVENIINPLIADAESKLNQAANVLAALNDFIDQKQDKDERGQPNGYPSLDPDGRVPNTQLPPLTNMTTVGAALAAPTPKTTITDGDKVGGILAGGAVLATWPWEIIKASMKVFTDTLYATKAQFTALSTGKQDNLGFVPMNIAGNTGIGGFTTDPIDDGVQSSGTYTPTPIGSNFREIINGGNFVLAAPTQAGSYNLTVDIINNASAGAITFTGFAEDNPEGDDLTATDGDKFKLQISKTLTGVTGTLRAVP